MGSSFGSLFKISTFGESHGVAVGVVIEGVPAGLVIDVNFIQSELNRRRPGQSAITTRRNETDAVQILSGIFESKATGAPLTLVIFNEDQRSKDYEHLRTIFRPSHADFTYEAKYGIRDYQGGGRSSARETAARVAAGAVAKLFLRQVSKINIAAYVSAVGNIKLEKIHQELDLSLTENTIVRCPDEACAEKMIALIEQVRKEGDTVGGIISCVVRGVPLGLGEPVFDKLHADLAKAMMSINAAHGFEYGSGFSSAEMRGSAHNDLFKPDFSTQTNYSGGIQGGISNGIDIYFRTAFKPVATLMLEQKTVDKNGKEAVFRGKGRHDPCVVPRATVIVEAMTALVLADHWLRQRVCRMDGFLLSDQ